MKSLDNKITKIILCLMFSAFCISAYPQYRFRRANKSHVYIPIQGDTIAFYPINQFYKGNCLRTYTCFYTLESIDKGFKPKYRYMPDEYGHTPEKEISGYMYVEHVEEFFHYKKDTYFIVKLIKVATGEHLVLSLPYNTVTMETNALERNWKINEVTRVSINIPFYSKSFYDMFRNKVGQTIYLTQDYDRESEAYKLLEFANKDTYLPKRKKFSIVDFLFLSTSSDLTNPGLYLKIKSEENKEHFIPATYYVGNAKRDYLMSEKMENIFDNHFITQDYIDGKIQHLPSDSQEKNMIDKYKGKEVYYGEGFYTSIGNYYKYEVLSLEDGKYYPLLHGRTYKCIDFKYLFPIVKTMHDLELYAILEDSCGVQFRFPALRLNDPYRISAFVTNDIYHDFNEFFVLKSEKEEKDLNQKSLYEEKLKQYASKYGVEEAKFIMGLYSSERRDIYETAYKKWGKNTARLIADGKVKLGWTKEQCRMSWGDPLDINTSIGSWGTHEQWCYRSSYLYFDNGKLTSIQN